MIFIGACNKSKYQISHNSPQYFGKSERSEDTLEQAFREQSPCLVVIPVDYRENLIVTGRLSAITRLI